MNRNIWYIHGKSYNLAPFLNKHPGGRRIWEASRGRDATALFESYHAPHAVSKDRLGAYLVDAPIPPHHQPTYDWENTPCIR